MIRHNSRIHQRSMRLQRSKSAILISWKNGLRDLLTLTKQGLLDVNPPSIKSSLYGRASRSSQRKPSVYRLQGGLRHHRPTWAMEHHAAVPLSWKVEMAVSGHHERGKVRLSNLMSESIESHRGLRRNLETLLCPCGKLRILRASPSAEIRKTSKPHGMRHISHIDLPGGPLWTWVLNHDLGVFEGRILRTVVGGVVEHGAWRRKMNHVSLLNGEDWQDTMAGIYKDTGLLPHHPPFWHETQRSTANSGWLGQVKTPPARPVGEHSTRKTCWNTGVYMDGRMKSGCEWNQPNQEESERERERERERDLLKYPPEVAEVADLYSLQKGNSKMCFCNLKPRQLLLPDISIIL